MLLLIFGPPAVGKMTVGRAITRAGRFRLFHNHMTIEPLLETFGFGTPAFNTLNAEFRRRVLEEAASHGIDLVFSLVWALDCADDLRMMQSYVDIFEGDVAFVELRAGLATRLERNRTAERLMHKASKRDVEWSDANVRELEDQWAMTSAGGALLAAELLSRHPYLVLDTTDTAPADTAQRILSWLDSSAPSR